MSPAMATELVILSSSPPMPSPGSLIREQRRWQYTMDLSSPTRPPKPDNASGILGGARGLSMGLKSPGRPGGIRGFTSASELLKDVAPEPELDLEERAKAVWDDLPTLNPKLDDTAKGDTDAGKAKTLKKTTAMGTAVVKNPRKKKSDAVDGKQSRIQGLGKVSKPTMTSAGLKRKTTVVPEEFMVNGINRTHSNDEVMESAFKERAVERRLDWTPPKNTLSATTDDVSDATPLAVDDDDNLMGPKGIRFKDLVGSFGYEGASNVNIAPVRLAPAEVTKKRSRAKILKSVIQETATESMSTNNTGGTLVDLTPRETVQGEGPPKVNAAKKRAPATEMPKEKVVKEKVPKVVKEKVVKEKIPKEKGPRKKPKTITEQATTPYAAGYTPTAAPLLQCLAAQQTAESHGHESVDSLPILKPGPTLKRLQKTRLLQVENGTPKLKTTSRRKKVQDADLQPALLSPRSAFKKMENQEVMFGTSSQLVRSSPSPEELFNGTEGVFVGTPNSLTDLALDQPKVIKSYTPATRGLWGAASRDLDGSLMEVDVIDLVNTPKACQVRKRVIKLLAGQGQESSIPVDEPSKTLGNDQMNVDGEMTTILNPTLDLQRDSAYASGTVSTDEKEQSEQTKPRSPQGRAVERPAESGMAPFNVSTEPCWLELAGAGGTVPKKPDFTGYTTAQLSNQIIKYGFKPIKNRNQMITLLEKCWEGKNRVALQTLNTSVNVSVSAAGAGLVEKQAAVSLPTGTKNTTAGVDAVGTVKKPRGRPKKSATEDVDPAANESMTKKSRGRPKMPISADVHTILSENLAQTLPTAPRIMSPKNPRPRPKEPGPLEISGRPVGSKNDRAGSSNKISQLKVSSSPRKRSIDEVADSDAESNDPMLAPGPKTPRRPTADPSAPTTIPVLTSAGDTPAFASLSDEEKQERRFEYISRAICGQPRSSSGGGNQGTKKPSFHEKILMYDPIVLEDLTVWLNTGGLAQVGYDWEVGAAEVRLWCERHSVCCLWKESLRNGTRTRY